MGNFYEIGGDLYYFSDGEIAGMVLGVIVIFIVIPVLCCCFCCGWCCFRGRRNRNSPPPQIQIYQPPQQGGTPGPSGQVVVNSTNVVGSGGYYATPQSNYQPTSAYGQGYYNGGYTPQNPSQFNYPEPRYNPHQFQQYQGFQYQQAYRPQGLDNRVPRNYLGQSEYDIYEPKRAQSASSMLPRPKVGGK